VKDTAELVEWYDKLSDGYDELYAEEQSVKYDLALKTTGARKFDIAIDIACGSGLFFEKLRTTCAFVVGVDVSREMLEKAKTRARNQDVSLVRSDCYKLPLKDETADCLFAISLLKAGSELGKQVSKIARVVKNDGFVVGTVFRNDDEIPGTGELSLGATGNLKDVSPREALFSGPARCFKNR